MRPRFNIIIAFLAFASVGANADTSLYEVSKGAQKIYLGGTIHVLRASDYPLPAEFEQAYEKSDVVVLETGSFRDEPHPEYGWVDNLLNKYNLPANLRGDGIYAVGRKAGPLKERYPSWLYT